MVVLWNAKEQAQYCVVSWTCMAEWGSTQSTGNKGAGMWTRQSQELQIHSDPSGEGVQPEQ